jgi:hypothetical protein
MHHVGVRDVSEAFGPALLSLARDHNIDAEPLPASVEVAVSQQQAIDVALRQFPGSTSTNIDAMLVSATDPAYGEEQADGTLRLLISERAVWLVLLPDHQIPIWGSHGGKKGPPFWYLATLAVLIDADSGEFLKAPALAS